MRAHYRPIGVAAVAMLVAGCASGLKQSPRSSSGFKCVDTASAAVGLGRAQARAAARGALSQETPDAKGFLVSSGVRRVRVISRRVDCQPAALPGMTRCTAHARLCGI